MYAVIFFAIPGSFASQRQMLTLKLSPSLFGFGFRVSGFGFANPEPGTMNPEPLLFFRERQFLDVQKIQLDRCRAAKDRDHNFQNALVRVDLFDLSGKSAERPRQDPNMLTVLEGMFRLRLLSRLGHM